MTPLAQIIVQRIRATGPITLADYMEICLLDPRHGYYATRDPFGAAGDFTTAPEIHQMFGELCGLALAQAWMDQGRPAPFTLAEAGPGRGTLMADILRIPAQNGFLDDLHGLAAYVERATGRPAFGKAMADHLAHWRAADEKAGAA